MCNKQFIRSIFLWLVVVQLYSCLPDKNEWKVVSSFDGSVPTPRHENAFIEHNGKLYLLGGRGLKPVDIYDPDQNVWYQGNAPPIEIHHFQPVVFNEYILVLGAMTGPYPNEQPLTNILFYHPGQNQWYVGDSIPQTRNRGSGGTVVYNNKIYWIGGMKNGHIGDHKNYFDCYNPIDKSWTILPNAPRSRDHFQASIVEGNLFVAGGRRTAAPYGTFDLTIPEVDYYNFIENTWNTLDRELPTPRAGTFNVHFEDKVFIGGGESSEDTYAHQIIEYFDWSDQEWGTILNMPIGRHGTGMVLWADKLWTSCGSYKKGGGPELNDLWCISINE